MTSRAEMFNPFESDVVTDAWLPVEAEVESINKNVLDVCLGAFKNMKDNQKSNSILLYGPAGSGKSHLLNRIQRSLIEGNGGQGRDCAFVYIRLHTVAGMLWRFLRKQFVNDLLRPLPDGSTQLKRIMAGRLSKKDQSGKDRQWWLKRFESVGEHLPKWQALETLFEELQINLEVGRIIKHLLVNKNKLQAHAWLRGDNLPEEDLETLGFTENKADTDPEDKARTVVLSLCSLAGSDFQVVFCFDQVEAIMRDREDRDSLFALAQFCAAIFNSTTNVLNLLSIQASLLKLFQNSAREANWARIAKMKKHLEQLSPEEARLMVISRLNMVPALEKDRQNNADNDLHPLDFSDLESLFTTGKTPARKLLHQCRQLFDGWLDKPIVVKQLNDFLAEKFNSHRKNALINQEPENCENLLVHALPKLARVFDEGVNAREADEEERSKKIDMVLSGPSDYVMLSICNQAHMRSLSAKLKKLKEGLENGSVKNPVIFRHEKMKISKTAKKAQEYWEFFKKESRAIVWGSPQVMASLEAFEVLISAASSGDLSFNGEGVSEEQVYEWLKISPDEKLAGFIESLIKIEPPSYFNENWDIIKKGVQEEFIIGLSELSSRLNLSENEILNCIATANQKEIRFIKGEPTVLFHYFETSAYDSEEADSKEDEISTQQIREKILSLGSPPPWLSPTQKLFHQCLAEMLGPNLANNLFFCFADLDREDDIESKSQYIQEHVYQKIFGPRLSSIYKNLDGKYNKELIELWNAIKRLVDWLTTLGHNYTMTSKSKISWSEFATGLQKDLPAVHRLQLPGWKRPVDVKGAQDMLFKSPRTGKWFVVSLVHGQKSQRELILGLAHLLANRISDPQDFLTKDHGISLVSLMPKREETPLTREITKALYPKIMNLIGQTAGVTD